MHVDLDELARRESEQVEWKEGVADPRDVVRTLVAFSNDLANLGGGYVVCGAQETRDEYGFPKLVRTGLLPAELKRVEGTVVSACRDHVDPGLAPLVVELQADDPARRILVFVAPATGHAHQFRDEPGTSGAFWVRVSRNTVIARNGLLRQLLVRTRALDRWDKRLAAGATIDAIDGLALREHLTSMGLWDASRPFEDYVSADRPLGAFVPPLCAKIPLGAPAVPRHVALLLFGREVQRWIPGSESVFSLYPGTDRSERHVERRQIDGDLVHQTRTLLALLDAQVVDVIDKEDPRPNLAKYPRRALHEAVENAMVHRDFEEQRPVRVTVFSDRIEIESPGGLVPGVDAEEFQQGRASPIWRNQSLSWFFNRLHLAQGEGQGIPTILREMDAMGSPLPRFEVRETFIRCTLQAHPRHAVMHEVAEAERLLVQGDLEEAERRLRAVLVRDAYHNQAFILICRVFQLQHAPERVASALGELGIDAHRLGSQAKLAAGEVLAASTSGHDDLAQTLLAAASQGRLDEDDTRRIARGLQRLRRFEQALSTIDEAIRRNPAIAESPSTQRVVGDLHIDLAKQCLHTARATGVPAQLRRAAREHAGRHLDQAEQALAKAAPGSFGALAEAVDDALRFLRRLRKHVGQAPRSRAVSDELDDELDDLLIVEED